MKTWNPNQFNFQQIAISVGRQAESTATNRHAIHPQRRNQSVDTTPTIVVRRRHHDKATINGTAFGVAADAKTHAVSYCGNSTA